MTDTGFFVQAVTSTTGADKEAIAWAPLVWTGQVKVGEENVTLSGTAEASCLFWRLKIVPAAYP